MLFVLGFSLCRGGSEVVDGILGVLCGVGGVDFFLVIWVSFFGEIDCEFFVI